MLAAIAEFERDLIRDRVLAVLPEGEAEGRHLGRSRIHHVDVASAWALRAPGHSRPTTAWVLGVHAMAMRRAIKSLSQTPAAAA
jgi:DNA invertase Pin-like site-specific DNA recombinase